MGEPKTEPKGEMAVWHRLGNEERRALLARCCGSSAWVDAMMDSMMREESPSSFSELIDRARRLWFGLSERDWLEAFAHHPKIGQRPRVAIETQEQAGALSADQEIQTELLRLNEIYEKKYGFIYLVCASGKSGAELLAILNTRLNSTRDAELLVATQEQFKILELRLKKFLSQS